MRRLILFLVFISSATGLFAQVTQSEADSIVLQRLSTDTRQHTILAKRDLQNGLSITTALGEILELDYSCWAYYVGYIEGTDSKANRYLIVKENSGSLLEVKTTNDIMPDSLVKWREVKLIDIPITEYSLESTSCQWESFAPDTVIVINSDAELENYLTCTDYPAVDFNLYSLLLVRGSTDYGTISHIIKDLARLSAKEYRLNIKVQANDTSATEEWILAVLVPKLPQNSTVSLNLYYPIVGVWEYKTPPIGLDCPIEATITLTFDAENIYVSTSPKIINTDSCDVKYLFFDGEQFVQISLELFSFYNGVVSSGYGFAITMFSPNSMELYYDGPLEDFGNHIRNYLFNRKTK